ncbi:MAG: hypothetical protein H6672_17300 [Anaerolineaceae bacterium]|nr:hypothetical protein [Anaerolineaceae bacterium]
MRIPIGLVLAAAVVAVIVVVIGGQLLIQPDVRLLPKASFLLDTITPNADGADDITIFTYSLSRNATITMQFEAADGTVYGFREDQPRIPGDYQVEFSGVVDGYTLPGEALQGEILRRLMPNGQYTWTLDAVGEDGASDSWTGVFTIADGAPTLPELVDFSISPTVFTPNQDGIYDRTQINVYLTKDANLSVYLEDETGVRLYVPEREEGRKPGEAGRHTYDYEGGVDLGADPPPDGTYTVYAVAQDAEGQVVQQTATLTIESGGQPLAEIVPQPVGASVVFDTTTYNDTYYSDSDHQGDLVTPPNDPQALSLTTITMPVGDLLVFKLTIENYSEVPLRTTGPEPGTVYQQEQRAATLGWLDESGAWRVGIDCDNAVSDYPWRWAIGTRGDNLVEETDPENGNTYYYLPAGEQSVIWGAIRMTDLNEARNPQNCWAGLIHEDVEISSVNSHVGAREIELVATE